MLGAKPLDAPEFMRVWPGWGLSMVKLYKGKLSRNDNDEKKNVEGITVKTVRPEGGIYEQCSDILLNWRDIRIKFGYIMLYERASQDKEKSI